MKKNKIPKLVEWSVIYKMPRKNALILFVVIFLFTGYMLYVSLLNLVNILLIVLLLMVGYCISWMDDNDAWEEN